MSNPFSNLRKYAREAVDPTRTKAEQNEAKETLATESLAACLQFSNSIKQAFVEFLFDGPTMPFKHDQCVDILVATQENIGRFGILDLYLSIPDTLDIVVEVKVGAPEGEQQLRDYDGWLKARRNGRQGCLFSLVCYPNKTFPGLKYLARRCTWRRLYDYFRNPDRRWSESDQKIIDYFTEYLEIQQIVMNWKPCDLAAMSKGLAAKPAIAERGKSTNAGCSITC